MTYLKKLQGFTLVELLVVIAIIGLLMGLLMVGLAGARGSRDVASCTNKQRQIGFAIQQYVTQKGTVPGYVNSGNDADDADDWTGRSWIIQILPYLGEEQRYKEILNMNKQSGSSVSESEIFASYSAVICPAQGDFYYNENNYPNLSYVGNCGFWDETNSETKFGIFLDRSSSGTKKKMTLDNIKDGTGNTILATENRNAGSWRLFKDDENKGWIGNVGFRWDIPSATDFDKLLPNSLTEDGYADIDWSDLDERLSFARPSSEHPGIVIILKADGSVDTLSDSVEEDVYFKLCCPDDSKAEKEL